MLNLIYNFLYIYIYFSEYLAFLHSANLTKIID